MSIRLAAVLMALALPWVAPEAAAATTADAPAHPVSPHECERWQAHVDQLRDSDDELERELGELHARPELAYCQEKWVRTSRFDLDRDLDWEPGSLPDFSGPALIVKWLVILGLGALGLWLVLRLRRLPAFQREPADAVEELPPPRFLAEAFETPLPDDIPAAAKEAWRQGDKRLALSLLYRGALERLPHGEQISQSATEGEVLKRLAKAQVDAQIIAHMRRLIACWLRAAWAQHPPDDAGFEALQSQWRALFAAEKRSRP